MRLRFASSYGTTYNNDVCVNISKAEGNPKNGDYVPYTTKAIPFYSYSYTKDNAGDDVWVGLSMYIRGYPYTERWGRPCFVFRSSFNGAYSYYTETVSPTDYDRIYDWIVFNYKGDSIFGEPNGPKGGDDFAELIDEPIPEPILPTVTAVNTGLTKLYWIAGGNKSKISDLMDWFNDPDLQFVNHLFKGDPIEALVGINLSPLPLTAVGTPNMHFLGIDTGIAADGAIADQYQEIDCGEIPIEMWEKDTYLDFSPHTRIKAVLPYIGIIDLNPDDIKGKKLGLKYIIDALTGSCVAHLTVNGNLRYEASGNCFINIPITNKDYSAAISAEKGAIASVADTLMSTGGLMAMGTGATPAGAIAMVGGSMVSNAINVATAHPSIRYIGGNTGATSGYMGFDRPFIMIEQPAQARPENDQHYFGMPSYMTDLIGSFSGFNKFNNFHIENIDCTEIERADIDNNLKNGVIIQNGSGTPNTTPVTTGNFVIVLLHNQSDSNTIGKIFKSGEGQRLKVEGKLLNNQSILNPSFVIETNDVYTYNYAYIPLLHRYYYIEDIIALSNNMIQLNMQSDALQSFKDQIKACKGICARAEKDDHVNYYIDDGAITVEQRMEIKTLQFKKNGERFNFTRSSAGFVLVVAAGD